MNVNGFFASRHQGLIKVAEVTDTAAWDKDFGRVYVYVGEHERMRLQHRFVLLVLSLSEQLSNPLKKSTSIATELNTNLLPSCHHTLLLSPPLTHSPPYSVTKMS